MGKALCPAQKLPPATMLRRWGCPYRIWLHCHKLREPDMTGLDMYLAQALTGRDLRSDLQTQVTLQRDNAERDPRLQIRI